MLTYVLLDEKGVAHDLVKQGEVVVLKCNGEVLEEILARLRDPRCERGLKSLELLALLIEQEKARKCSVCGRKRGEGNA